jgi:lipopolysaccharide export system protein LptC
MRSAADRARQLTQRALTIAALLAGGAMFFRVLVGPDDDAMQTGPAAEQRGYYLTDAKVTEFGPDGRPRIVVRARAVEQQLSDDSVDLADLTLDYATPRLDVWHLTADRGHMPRDRGSLLLSGNVRVAGAADPAGHQAVILTDQLSYDTQANLIQTAAPVAVQFGPHELHGRGLRVVLNAGTLRLESNVNGRFTP